MPEDGCAAPHAALNAALGEVRRQRPSGCCIAQLEEAGIPCGPLNDGRELLENLRLRHFGMVWELPQEQPGQAGLLRTPLTFAGHAPGIRCPAPALVEHADGIPAESARHAAESAAPRAAKAFGE